MTNLEDVLVRKRWARWAFACLIWALIVLFNSTRSTPPGRVVPWTESLKVWAGYWSVGVLFVFVIMWCDRLLPVRRDAILTRLALHIPLCAGMTILSLYVTKAVLLGLSGDIKQFSLSFEVLRQSWSGLFHTHALVYWGIVGLYIAWESHSRLRDRQIRTAELERQLTVARLEALRTQLNPHFLFNALNTISAHVERTPRTARRMLEQLGELLRMSLSHSEDPEIPLAEEMEFIGKYLSLQQARFGDSLHIATCIDPDVMEAMVPTFLLEPLVENAIRHGIAPRAERGHVDIRAWRENGWLHLAVKDDGPGLPKGWDAEKSDGIGIQNTRERLRCLYGADHAFRIDGAPGEGVIVEIGFPFRTFDGPELRSE